MRIAGRKRRSRASRTNDKLNRPPTTLKRIKGYQTAKCGQEEIRGKGVFYDVKRGKNPRGSLKPSVCLTCLISRGTERVRMKLGTVRFFYDVKFLMASRKGERGPYMCQAISRACDIIDAFQNPGDQLTLTQIAGKTGLSTSTAFRILYTLEQRGLVLRVGDRQYQLNIRPPKRRRHRIGFASQSQEFAFSRTVAESLISAAAKADIDLLVLDNHYNGKAALRKCGNVRPRRC
jgi:hypothetical protein